MDVSLMGLTQHPSERDPQTCFEELLEQTRLAADRGFSGVFVGEHHFTEDIYFDNLQTLARLTPELGEEMIAGTSVCLLPLHQAPLLAERIATLDVATGGNVVVGAATGYRDREFSTLGIDKDERGKRIEEGLEVLRRLWQTDDASFQGEHFTFENVVSRPQPIQQSGPPVWLGGSSPAAVRRAAELGDAWLIDPISPISRLEKAVGLYNDTLTDEPACRPIRRDIYVAETTEEAIETAAPHLLEKYESLVEWGIIEDDTTTTSEREQFERVREGRYLIGDPDRVIRELEDLNDRLGVDHLVARVQWPGMDHERATKAIELIGEEVIPRVESL